MTDWASVMRAVSPRAKTSVVAELAPHFDQMFEHYAIQPGEEQAEFIAQSAHETAGFTTLVEFGPKDYFKRYDGRKDLGNTKPGWGWLYRGRGIFQLTGFFNYRKFGPRVGVDLVKFPDKAAEGFYAAALACIYWCDRSIGQYARAGDVKTVTKKINGGLNGFRDRQVYLAKARKALGVKAPVQQLSGVGFMSVSLEEHDVPLRSDVREVQQRLAALGYHMVGKADGMVGTSTVAAISAFQHDNGLDTTGQLDDATRSAIMDDAAEQRSIPDERANGSPEGSSILSAAGRLKALAGGVGITGGASLADTGLSKVEAVKSYYDRAKDILEPFAALKAVVFSGTGLAVIAVAVAIAVGVYAWRIDRARTEDFRTHKTA